MKTQHRAKKCSLFVGRWQPFHEGHKALVKTILKKGKPIVIAIRDTEIDHKNPYTTYERWTMIQNALKEYGDLVKIIVIPDIDEICYGRKVGYKIRKIDLPSGTAKISGTKIRNKVIRAKPIIWLTGQSGSGKTTIANILKQKIGGVILDGNEMRKTISLGLGFSKTDREIHNLRVARLAKVLSRETPVIVAIIAPFESTRRKIDTIAKPIWVYVERNVKITRKRPYEIPKRYNIKVNSDKQTSEEQVGLILKYLKHKYKELKILD
jgi:adenylylsulfate kinase